MKGGGEHRYGWAPVELCDAADLCLLPVSKRNTLCYSQPNIHRRVWGKKLTGRYITPVYL